MFLQLSVLNENNIFLECSPLSKVNIRSCYTAQKFIPLSHFLLQIVHSDVCMYIRGWAKVGLHCDIV